MENPAGVHRIYLDEAVERAAAERFTQMATLTPEERKASTFTGGVARIASLVARKGSDQVVLQMVSRSEHRAAANATEVVLMPPLMWRSGIGLSMADVLLERLGAPWDGRIAADSPTQGWEVGLRDGLDAFARVGWCLRFGYTTAAAAIARKAFERWSYNIVSSMNLGTPDDETDTQFYARVWSASSNYVDGRNLGDEWAQISELLHGRPIVIGGRTIRLALDMDLADRVRVHRLIARLSEVWLRQVRGAVVRLAHEQGKSTPSEEEYALQITDAIRGLPAPPDFLSVFWEPLLYGFVNSDLAQTYASWGEKYRSAVARRAEDAIDIGIFSDWMSIEERWARAIDVSMEAFENERAFFGDDFSPFSVRARINVFRQISEMADLAAATVAESEQANALRAAAAALESAWVIWLQDIDDSLSLARSVLESTARARVYRTKPEKAKVMESGPQAHKAPYRWVEAAGWGRLAPFVRALSEYAHMQARSRHRSSWNLLVKVQKVAEEDVPADKIARRNALEKIAEILAHEVVACLKGSYPDLMDAFGAAVLDQDLKTSESNFEKWLDANLEYKRTYQFGDADYEIARSEPGPKD